MRTREERLKYRKAWYIAHKESESAKRLAYYAANAERLRAKARVVYQSKPKRNRKAYMKQWHADHPTPPSRYHVNKIAYRKRNPEKEKARHAEYGRRNRHKCRAIVTRYRARKAGNGGSHTAEEKLSKFFMLGNVCYYCWEPKKLEADHDLPIVRGGTDNIDNILPACRSCNSSKGKRTSVEFMFRKVA